MLKKKLGFIFFPFEDLWQAGCGGVEGRRVEKDGDGGVMWFGDGDSLSWFITRF